MTAHAPTSENAHRGYRLLLGLVPRTRTLLTTGRRWRNRVSVRRRASGRVHYNYFRDVDPAVGRYVESDPTGLSGGLNTFAYVYSNPVGFSDPDGLDVTINITNRAYSPTGNSITGTINVASSLTPISPYAGHTLENSHGGVDHDRRPSPGGSYDAFIRTNHTPHRIELKNVRGYLNIQIHPGNFPGDFEGCFGPGNTAASDYIGDSVNAQNKILSIIEADGSGHIRVNVAPAPRSPDMGPAVPRLGPVQPTANPFFRQF